MGLRSTVQFRSRKVIDLVAVEAIVAGCEWHRCSEATGLEQSQGAVAGELVSVAAVLAVAFGSPQELVLRVVSGREGATLGQQCAFWFQPCVSVLLPVGAGGDEELPAVALERH